tara:strand:+ start:180 stop:656 length:477 start_codon:yes stop_codon:yes gene_type:complete
MTDIYKDQMFQEIEEFFGYNINSRTRKREVLDIRHAWRFAMRELGYTYKAIGDMTGHDHATVMNSLKIVNKMTSYKNDFVDLLYAMKGFVNDFHKVNGLQTDKKREEYGQGLLHLYVDLLDYVSSKFTKKELTNWINAAGITEIHFKSIVTKLNKERA